MSFCPDDLAYNCLIHFYKTTSKMNMTSKNEDNFKNENDLKNEDNIKMTSHHDSHTTTDVKPEMILIVVYQARFLIFSSFLFKSKMDVNM